MYTWFVDPRSIVSVYASICNCFKRLDKGSTEAKHVVDQL